MVQMKKLIKRIAVAMLALTMLVPTTVYADAFGIDVSAWQSNIQIENISARREATAKDMKKVYKNEFDILAQKRKAFIAKLTDAERTQLLQQLWSEVGLGGV